MPGKKSYHYLVADPELEIAAQALDQEGHNVFFGVGLRRGDLGPYERGTKADIVALPGFWADVDIKGINHVADNLPANIVDVIQGILQPFDWEPSAVVNSGGGIHAYWLFEQPLIITDANRSEVEEMSRAFQERLALGAQKRGWKWDMTADTPRVLRPVGTCNRKGSDQGRAPVPVEFMGSLHGRYPYALFQAALKAKAGGIASILGRSASGTPMPVMTDRPGAPAVPVRTIDTREPQEIIAELKSKMLRNRKPDRRIVLSQILKGESFAQPGERDKVLQQVASWIAFYDCNADPEILAEVLVPSLESMALEEPKGAMTLDDAVEKIARAQSDARRKNALNQAADEGIKAALQHAARQSYKAPPQPQSPAPPADQPKKPPSAELPLDAVLRGATSPALAVVPGGADEQITEVPVGAYTKEEILGFIERQSKLSGEAISFEDWKKRWVITSATSNYIFVNGRYLPPVPTMNFRASIEKDLSLLPEFIDGQLYYSPKVFKSDGTQRTKTTDEVQIELSSVARRVVADLTIPESYFDDSTDTFYEAVCPLRYDLVPKFDHRVQTWLEKIGGPDADKLLDWIATITFLQAPSCGLFLSGPPNTGKTVLANGLARLWTHGGYTRMEDISGPFNEDVATCPLLVADEALPDGGNGKPISTKRLRDMISADSRSLRRKFMPNAKLKGTVRCMFLANSPRLLDLGDEILGSEALEAVASRFLHIEVTKEPAAYIESIGGRHGGTRNWIEGDQIAQHALWLRDNRQVTPAGRFWVKGHEKRMHRMLAAGNQVSSNVLEWIVKYLTKPHKDIKATFGVLVGGGEVWINTTTINEFWDTYIKNKIGAPPVRRIANALEGLLTENGKDPEGGGRLITDPRGTKRRYFGLRVPDLLSFALDAGIGNVEELQEMINFPRKDALK